ncbi:hypothetical protein [Streptomyces sp. NPDC048641]|uniref:hypothetical protein n=1 Tax=unclassified Streptomyces TaxID=2593676 RepID=UPI003430ADE5
MVPRAAEPVGSHAETYSTGAQYDIFTAHYPDVKGELGGETARPSSKEILMNGGSSN